MNVIMPECLGATTMSIEVNIVERFNTSELSFTAVIYLCRILMTLTACVLSHQFGTAGLGLAIAP